MKTMEELNLMTVPQLKGIATGLGVETKANVKKDDLVRLVYDVQQPDAVEAEEGRQAPAEEQSINDLENKDITDDEKLDEKFEIIEQHFEGVIEKTDEDIDGVPVFAVFDADNEEVVRDTFQNIWDEVLKANAPVTEANEPMEVEDMSMPAEAEPEVTTGDKKAVDKALKPLKRVGLSYEINGGCVTLQHGSKKQTTTINQPLSKVVRVAEHMCKVV